MTASDFPIAEVRKLEQQVREEKQAHIKCLESRNADMEKIEESLAAIEQKVESLTASKEEVAILEQRVVEHMNSAEEGLRMQQEDISALGKEIHELKKKEEERDTETENTGKKKDLTVFKPLFKKQDIAIGVINNLLTMKRMTTRQTDLPCINENYILCRLKKDTSHIKINETVTIPLETTCALAAWFV